MSEYETISIRREGNIGRIAFNRPDKLNTFDTQLRLEFLAAARELNLDDSLRAIVLTGEGRAFGAGADLSEGDPSDGLGIGRVVEDMLNNEYKPGILAIANSTKVWIAAINGPCAGISYSYAMACDVAVMAEGAFLYQPFAQIGLVPDGGSTWLLNKLVGSRRAYELMMLGEKVSPEQALDWGMINRVFPAEGFEASAMAFAKRFADASPLSARYTKEALRIAATATLSQSISAEAALQVHCIDSEDSRNAVEAFFAKKPYEWQGR